MAIVCGTDLSPGSTRALEVARALAAQRGDDEVLLVHVVDGDTEDNIDPSASLAEALNEPRARLEAMARSQAGAASGPRIRAELVVGPADETLVNFAESVASDLIVVAAESRGARSAKLGATAGKIVARTHLPVIVVRDPAPWLAFARGAAPLKILLGIDESATSDLAIQWTQTLGTRAPIAVTLGAIYYPDDAAVYYGLPPRSLVETDPEIERLMQRDLLRRYTGATSVSTGIAARARRGLGRIADHMMELARDERVDAIVVGTGQRTGLGRLGSVSSVIVQDAPQSVVCVPPQAAIATRTVPGLRQSLVATDLSPFANRAVPYSFALTPADGEVHLVHVVKEDAEIDEADLIRQLTALVPAGAPQTVRTHVVRGDEPATTIAQCAARFGVDVICIASHGRSGLTRALVGSVADRVLRVTRLPVLVLRPS